MFHDIETFVGVATFFDQLNGYKIIRRGSCGLGLFTRSEEILRKIEGLFFIPDKNTFSLEKFGACSIDGSPLDRSSSHQRLIRYCISHELPLLPKNWFDEVIKLGDYGRGSEIHISQLSSFWDESRDLSYGAAGSYCIPYAITKFNLLPEFIEINSFRKRVLIEEIGKTSSNYPLMREVLLADASQIDVESGILKTLSYNNFLISQPLHFTNGYLEQYALVHHKTDFLDYAQLAVERGIISKDDYQDFLECKTFIPGGCELGIFPCKWLLGILSQLEDLGRHFILKHKVRIASYDSYQVRCIGFLSERLGSFLLLKELNARFNNQIPSTVFGHMTTVVTDKKANYQHATARGKHPHCFRQNAGTRS